MVKRLFYFIWIIFIYGCSSTSNLIYDLPDELRDAQLYNEFYSIYSPYIAQKKIFIDAGHGGSDRRNKGYNSEVTEADVNLKVALDLKDYLERAGAFVFLSRDKDTTISLFDRSVMADSIHPLIFISIHHNAPPDDENIWVNYTSTYYHSQENYYEFNPFERDLAKYVQRDLAYALRNSGGLGSFDGTYSDYSIYPGQGFSVLRETLTPGSLVEAAFNTHHLQSQLLLIDEYNKIEAWGIFKGLCKFFKTGFPKISILSSDTVNSKSSFLSFWVEDSSEIDNESIIVKIDSLKSNKFSFDNKTKIISVDASDLTEGEHKIKIVLSNKNKIHNYPFEIKFFVSKKITGEF